MERRDFLKTLPALGLLTGATRGFAPGIAQAQSLPGALPVRIDAPSSPLVDRAFEILKNRIQQRSPVQVEKSVEDPRILLSIDRGLQAEGYRIDEAGGAIRIAGGSPQGLIYGIGKFLRGSLYGKEYQPASWRGESVPQGSMRGMYFATHFHNWHHVASEAEIARYMEDLMLWGVNAIMICFPFINFQDWNDPQAGEATEMAKKYARISRALGLQFGVGTGNTLFKGAPDSIRATPLPDPTHRRGNSGHPICPSNPEGIKFILDNLGEMFRRFSSAGLDFIVHWPYDEGGCACEKCMPWGSNGYLRMSREITQLGRQSFPGLKSILSTWMYDTPPEGEWAGLTDALAKENSWVDYILADSHEEFPRYPLDSGVPGHLPLLNFPEISMWGNWPWGGVGANPLPSRFQRLWDQVKHAVSGGFPYSEGIYEDINKAIVAQFYWNRDQSAQAILAEYAAYEFGETSSQDIQTLVDCLEAAAGNSYQKQPVDALKVQQAFDLAERIHSHLPEWGRKSWRWEILHLRALLDRERFIQGGLETPAAQTALGRLMEIFHCQMETDDGYHHRVRPKFKGATTKGKEL